MKRLPLLMILLLAASAKANTYYVRQTGDDTANGRSAATAFHSVVRAAQSLNHGDSVVIGPGTYHESAFFADRWGSADNRIAIRGDESGKQTGDAAGAVVIEATNATEPALLFYRMRALTLSGLTLRGAGQGLRLEDCRDALVERCSFELLAKGLSADGCEDFRAESLVFARCAIAASLQGCVRTRVAHVTVASSTSVGILLLTCGPGAIRNSLFANNSTNFVADNVSAANWSSDYNSLTGPTGPWGAVPIVSKIYEWSSASGQDRHSVFVSPPFANPDRQDLRPDAAVSWAGGLPGMDAGLGSDLPYGPPQTFIYAVKTGASRASSYTVRTIPMLDRNGAAFRSRGEAVGVGAYDYPDPQPSGAWKKLSAKLAGGPRQSAGVYRVDGTLVRTLLADAAGVHDLWWDGRDDLGQPAAAGAYQVRAITHDVRLVDDGSVGDNGNPKGVYNPDNADRVAVFPDGSFVVTSAYDEAGYVLRRYSASAQPIFAANLDEGGFWGLTPNGDELVGGLGKGKDARLVRLLLPGSRAKMETGADSYPLTTEADKDADPRGVAVLNGAAYVSIAGLNVVRVIDLKTGQKRADYAVPSPGDIVKDGAGILWIISGKEIVSLNPQGQVARHLTPGLNELFYLAAAGGRLAAVDRKVNRVAVMDIASGKMLRTLGQDRNVVYWMAVRPDVFRDPRGCAFLPDGRLVVTEQGRIRILSTERMDDSIDVLSNFVDAAVVHPTNPEYVYTSLGAYHTDPQTGAWQWVLESAPPGVLYTKETDPWKDKRLGSPGQGIVLGGRPFIAYYDGDRANLTMVDVTEPLKPHIALDQHNNFLGGGSYNTMTFTKGGDIVTPNSGYGLDFKRVAFKGLDRQNTPLFDWTNPQKFGPEKDATTRQMKEVGAISADRTTGDVYYGAVTAQYNKMVPGWGADATGVGKSLPDGKPQWFSLSSGGNYMSVSSLNDGTNTWTMAAKSFGGQIDVFDSDGLRVTTGNWSWPSAYQIGFVDIRYGVHAYLRPDGKPGAYVEDDAIGRLARARLDGADTLRKQITPIQWEESPPASTLLAGALPLPDVTGGKTLTRGQAIAAVPPLAVNGDWSQWQQAGVAAQIIALPSAVSFKRNMAADLLHTFREGTMIGAIAHDDKNFYVYTVVADDTPHFDAPTPGTLFAYDSIELWLEEEQFGIGLTRDGKPGLMKYRFHDRAGTQWKANYALPAEDVWGAQIADLSTHPLGRQLAAITGVSFAGKPGYALMARIPFEEVKLVGGIAGREGTAITNMTGQAGEVVRVAVSLNNISAWGRVQDYQVDWPVGKMFSDPTRSYPMSLGK